MTVYFADFDLATGDNDGTSWANAWRTLADVQAGSNGTQPTAGDTVLCQGTDSVSSTVTFTADNTGTPAAGYLKLIGVADGCTETDPDTANTGGTDRAVIDGQTNALSCITLNACDYLWFENFEIKNAGSSGTANHGITYATSSDNGVMVNSYVHDCYGSGFYSNAYMTGWVFERCRFSANYNGLYRAKACEITRCRFDSHTNRAIDGIGGEKYYIVILHDNEYGIYGYGIAFAKHIIGYNNTNYPINIQSLSYDRPLVEGCRTLDNGTGLQISSSYRLPVFYSYFDNTTDISGYYDEILNNGASTLVLAGTDTDGGFTDTSSDDYTLASDATFRRVAVQIP